MKTGIALLFLLAGTLVQACTDDPKHSGAEQAKGDTTLGIRLTYLGCNGFLMQWHGEALLIDPFVSNPDLAHSSGAMCIAPDTAAIKREIGTLPGLRQVKSIIVSHSHYDHLMDVPYIYQHLVDTARLTIYGNRTAQNILYAIIKDTAHKVKNVEPAMADSGHAGKWIYLRNGHMRILPIRAEHAPHYYHVHLFKGEVRKPLQQLPPTAGGWKEGQTLAFLIDFMQGDTPAFRLYIQGAASNPPLGYPPSAELKRKKVDVAILCAASFSYVHHYPEGIIRYLQQPPHLVIAHWENFFKKHTQPIETVPFTDMDKFMRKIKALYPNAKAYVKPLPQQVIEY